MNIFVTSPCPQKSAQYLDDKRVIKMILESVQLLSTALNCLGSKGPYKTTHLNHPCSIWVRESRSNYLWLIEHTKSLLEEYTKRYGKVHKCQQYVNELIQGSHIVPDKGLTPWPNCTIFKDTIKDIHEAYKQALIHKWQVDKRKPTWYRVNESIDVITVR